MRVDLVIVGAGPAGMSAALAAYEKGIRDILILERGNEPGGILNQCIHNGFGLHTFKEELTGPEYAARYISMIEENSDTIKYYGGRCAGWRALQCDRYEQRKRNVPHRCRRCYFGDGMQREG